MKWRHKLYWKTYKAKRKLSQWKKKKTKKKERIMPWKFPNKFSKKLTNSSKHKLNKNKKKHYKNS